MSPATIVVLSLGIIVVNLSFLDDVTVSRRHAEFVRHSSAFEVKDIGSLNGTYFDGVLVDQALLHDGAEVQVGKFRMTFYASRHDVDAAEVGA